MNNERLETFASTTNSTFVDQLKKNINNDNFNYYNNLDNSVNEENLKNQVKILQNKITILTKRINIYENEYFTKNQYFTEQMKNFGIIEKNYKNQIDNLNLSIEELKKENEILKRKIGKNINNENERNLSNHKIIEYEINNLENQKQVNNLINLVREYSKEISKLKEENFNLKNETYNNNMLNQNNLNYKNNDYIIMHISNYINNELYLINQWIDTYIGDYYDKNYEVPSLLNDDSFCNDNLIFKLKNYLQIDLLKHTLEKSRNNINSLLNQNEKNLIEYKNLFKQIENQNFKLKNELSDLKRQLMDLNYGKNIENNNRKNENENNKLKSILIKSKEMNDKYLNEIYLIISNELNDILKDFNFQFFHNKIISNNFIHFNNLNEMLNNSLDCLIQFIQSLKYDYIKIKQENLNYLNEKINNNFIMN
jgi:hypothetical protein